jgi:two-component system, chemotaxis family, CheB/CheR fusion protein
MLTAGQAIHFAMADLCHSRDEQGWYIMHIAPTKPSNGGVIASQVTVRNGSDGSRDQRRD